MQTWLLWWQTMLLVSIRLAIGLGTTPILGMFGMPALARLIIILSMAMFAVNGTFSGVASPLFTDWGELWHAVAEEVAAGLLLSLGIHAGFAAASIAGSLMDAQLGINLGAVLNPLTKSKSSVMGSGMAMLSMLIFFFSDAYALLLDGVLRTFDHRWWPTSPQAPGGLDIALQAGGMFNLGLALAAPLVVALLLADAVIGLLSRKLPQLNVLFLGMPLKLLLGLSVLSISVRYMGQTIHEALLLPVKLISGG